MPSQPHIFPGISQIAQNYKGLLLDAYGVFWGGNAIGPLPGAKEAMKQLVSEGKIIGVLSNATQLSEKEIAKIEKSGFNKNEHFHFFVTSGEIVKRILSTESLPFPTPRKTFYLFGEPNPNYSSHEMIFHGTAYTETSDIFEADFIYISIPHIEGKDQTDPSLFLEAVEQLHLRGLPMVCPNPDQFAHEGNPPQAFVRQGSIARMYEALGGKVFYIGKPHLMSFETAMNHFRQYHIVETADILMVGDTPETDIRGARSYGMASALTIKTGIMADRIAHRGFPEAIQEISSEDSPDYFIERFCQ